MNYANTFRAGNRQNWSADGVAARREITVAEPPE